jgi:poly(hydroxyalkanoate) depolymerase family esterase
MKPLLAREMVEATRLTRAGRLGEAVTLLQSMLRGERASEIERVATTALLPAPTGRPAENVSAGPAAASGAATQSTPGRRSSLFARIDRNLAGLHRGARRKHLADADIAPAAGTYIARTFANEAGSRSYKLYIPSRADGERPLIVMLHGCTQSADDFAAGTRMNFAAELEGCFVAYPEQPAAANASKCWNWFKRSDQRRGHGEPALIAGITRQIMADYGIDARCVYIAGLSAGGATAAIMGEAYPDLYAAVGVHSGLACGAATDLASALAAMSGRGPVRTHPGGVHTRRRHVLPTIVFHGDQDTTVHPRNAAEVIARANTGEHSDAAVERETVASGRRYTRSIKRDAHGRSVLEQWELHGAGHAWSGGNSAGSYTDPEGPDATHEMLRFFLEHVQSMPHARDGQ